MGKLQETRWWHILSCVNAWRCDEGFFKVQGLIRNIFHPLNRYKWMLFNYIPKGIRFIIYWDMIYEFAWRWMGSSVDSLYMCSLSTVGEETLWMNSKTWKVSYVCLILAQLTVLVESLWSTFHLWHLDIWGAQLKDRYICAKHKMSYMDETEILCLEHCIWVSVARWHFNFFRIRDWNFLLRVGSCRDRVCVLFYFFFGFVLVRGVFLVVFLFYMFERGFYNWNGCSRNQGSEMKFIFSLRKFIFVLLKGFSDYLITS